MPTARSSPDSRAASQARASPRAAAPPTCPVVLAWPKGSESTVSAVLAVRLSYMPESVRCAMTICCASTAGGARSGLLCASRQAAAGREGRHPPLGAAAHIHEPASLRARRARPASPDRHAAMRAARGVHMAGAAASRRCLVPAPGVCHRMLSAHTSRHLCRPSCSGTTRPSGGSSLPSS